MSLPVNFTVLEEWYIDSAKTARWMDLVGDYAGDELFIIDGESLLQTVLDDELLAIGREEGCSFQILHAFYILETFLEQFTSRQANIEIVFFEQNLLATVKPGIGKFESSSRLLARQLLLKHLEQLHLPVYHFRDFADSRWLEHERSGKPMFALVNDVSKGNTPNSLRERYTTCQRALIFRYIQHGLPIALLNGIEFRDSKIMTFIIERQSGRLPLLIWSNVDIPEVSALNACLPIDKRPSSNPTLLSDSKDSLLTEICGVFLDRGLLDIRARALLFVFVFHVYLLEEAPIELRSRSTAAVASNHEALLRNEFFPTLFQVLLDGISHFQGTIDIDTHIFLSLLQFISDRVDLRDASPDLFLRTLRVWAGAGAGAAPDLHVLQGMVLPDDPTEPIQSEGCKGLLPFSHPVLDSSLSALHTEGYSELESQYFAFSRNGVMFTDVHHWHNQKELTPTGNREKPSWRAERSRQRFMKNLQNQAETLTGALGRGLRQITVTVSPTGLQRKPAVFYPQQVSYPKFDSSSSLILPMKKKKTGLTKKELTLQKIADEKSKGKDEENKRWFINHLMEYEDSALAQKISALDRLKRSHRLEQSKWLNVDFHLYGLHLVMLSWIAHHNRESDTVRDEYTVDILRRVQTLSSLGRFSEDRASPISSVLNAVGLQDYVSHLIPLPEATNVRLTFRFVKLHKSSRPLYLWMKITEHPIRWQLRLFGSYMDRSMDGADDPRVDFQPDGWQRKALDCIDNPSHSLLVVAPTSAGKTFISFYAMEKVLRKSDDGILVYIAPTKALVNQIAAEIYARYSKKLSNGALWAIHTRDYRINDPQRCQILVTVPEMLAIMLLSPSLARKWTPRIKRIILDEIHTIGQQAGGAVWEQIILLAPCPIIGLSATVGSPYRFNDWLASVAKTQGWQHSFIQHEHRYSHLRKFSYNTRNIDGDQGEFAGLSAFTPTDRLRFLHPISMISFGQRALPEDLALEAQDTLTLFDAIQATCPSKATSALDPVRFFDSAKSRLLKQADILAYEKELKDFVSVLRRDGSPGPTNDLNKIVMQLRDDVDKLNDAGESDLLAGLLSLACDLHSRQLLPAIFFSFDRHLCEVVAQHLTEQLTTAENNWKEKSPEWQRQLKQWGKWKDEEKTRTRLQERTSKARRKNEDEAQREDPADRRSWQESFNPEAPLADFSFLGPCSMQDLQEEIDGLWRLHSTSWMIKALKRGIAVHHAGMPKEYRSLIENLFRRGIVRLMISTGTLALGINAPAKTSVFCGDSPFLTALMYRQCAGRAGRRGYDLLGNVVFYGLPIDRIQRLVLSKLPSLGGSFPLTPTLTLRLLNLLHGSQNADVAVKAIQSLLELPQITFGSRIGRSQLLHHLRFNIEYLRRTKLINELGVPINLCAIGAHLYYTEPSNFAFIVLLHSGILHRISTEGDPEREYICLMSQLFGRRYLPGVLVNSKHLRELKRRYPSMIEHQPIREDARAILSRHVEEVRDIFFIYVSAYARQHAKDLGPDNVLPLSKICYPVETEPWRPGCPLAGFLRRTANPKVLVRSRFVANSGHSDNSSSSVEELAHSVRSGIHLNVHAIPNMGALVDMGVHTLNAYLLDFYIHGQVKALEAANGIRRGDVWYYLQDFMLTLMTVKASLQQFLIQTAACASEADQEEVFAVGVDAAERDDDSDDDEADGFQRPFGVSGKDWRLYEMVRDATAKFEEKFRDMWA